MFSKFRKENAAEVHPPVGKGGSFSRHSRGWSDLLQHLKSSENLRVLDFGATSPSNINYLTSLGHSVYMAHIVQDASKPEWLRPAEGGAPGAMEFDVDRFEAANLDFSGREFNVVLLWDTANYLPPAMVPVLFKRMREVLQPDGRLLAFFHGKKDSPETTFSRFQLTDSDNLLVHKSGEFPIQEIYQTRQIEKFLDGYSSVRFFLGRDNVREAIAVR
jgi:SAM-dependent methyltransferase